MFFIKAIFFLGGCWCSMFWKKLVSRREDGPVPSDNNEDDRTIKRSEQDNPTSSVKLPPAANVINKQSWWTDQWVDSLMQDIRSESNKDSSNQEDDDMKGTVPDMGDYPIICRVGRTHSEFPPDLYSDDKNVFYD